MTQYACQPWDVQERSSASTALFHIVKTGISIEEATSPSYWRNALRLLKQWGTIDLVAEDNAWEATVRIIAVDDKEVTLRVLSKWEADKRAAGKAPDGYRVEFIAGSGWRVTDPDGELVADKKPSEVDALAAAQSNAKKTRRSAAAA